MKHHLNSKNYEQFFFRLIENDIKEEERVAVMEEIYANPFYTFEWECWKKAKIQDESKDIAVLEKGFFEGLKDAAAMVTEDPVERKAFIFPRWLAAGIAAGIFWALIYFSNYETKELSVNKIPPAEISEHFDEKQQGKELTKKAPSTEVQLETKVKEAGKSTKFVRVGNESERNLKYTKPDSIQSKPINKLTFSSDFTLPDPALLIQTEPNMNRKYRRKFTVSESIPLKQDVIVTLAELEKQNASLLRLLDNKSISVVRMGKKLYVKLSEKDSASILVCFK